MKIKPNKCGTVAVLLKDIINTSEEAVKDAGINRWALNEGADPNAYTYVHIDIAIKHKLPVLVDGVRILPDEEAIDRSNMPTPPQPLTLDLIIRCWKSVVGDNPQIAARDLGREKFIRFQYFMYCLANELEPSEGGWEDFYEVIYAGWGSYQEPTTSLYNF